MTSNPQSGEKTNTVLSRLNFAFLPFYTPALIVYKIALLVNNVTPF